MFRIPTAIIAKYCNPFEGCWLDLDTPISIQEVRDCVAADQGALLCTTHPLWETPRADARERHVRKIAFFVRHGYQEPLQLDVGVPALGYYVEYLVQDGNHRLAADIFKTEALAQKSRSLIEVSGSIEHAKELGLWRTRTVPRANRKAA